MRKIIKPIIFILIAASIFGALGASASALFGSGYEFLSSDVRMIKSGLIGKKIKFSDSDFKAAFCITDFDSVTIERIPSSNEGTLLLAGRRVKDGQTIKRRYIGSLVFVPASDSICDVEIPFSIKSGGAVTEGICRLRFTDKVNYAPRTAEERESSLSLTTQAQISVYGTIEAHDPEGDRLEYIIAKYPKSGRLSFTDSQTGKYKYTPIDGFTGYDSFTYVVRDEYGNYSEPREVGIRIVERMSEEIYRDMTDRTEYNAAVAMSAMGIMNGRTLGDDLYFMPDEAVSRAEFVAMAMKAYGLRPDSSLRKSFFDDDGDIPTSLVGYIATAQRVGLISGDFGEEGLTFSPNRAVTVSDAAEIISKLMGVSASEEDLEYAENTTVSASARASVYAMYTLGIFDGDIESCDGAKTVSRAEAAEYLYRMLRNK